MRTIDEDQLVACPQCRHPRLDVRDTRVDTVGALTTRVRKRWCQDCGFTVFTAEVPLTRAIHLYED